LSPYTHKECETWKFNNAKTIQLWKIAGGDQKMERNMSANFLTYLSRDFLKIIINLNGLCYSFNTECPQKVPVLKAWSPVVLLGGRLDP
jgi:hypothetical protein